MVKITDREGIANLLNVEEVNTKYTYYVNPKYLSSKKMHVKD